MRISRSKGSHSAENSGRQQAVEIKRRKLPQEKKYLMFFIFLSIAALMIIILAAISVGAVDKSRYKEYMELAAESIADEKYDSALRYLRKAQSIENNEECLLYMADCYEELGNFDKALETLRLLDTRNSDIASKIAGIEAKKSQQQEKDTVSVAGKEYPIDASVAEFNALGLSDAELEEIVKLYALTSLSLADNDIVNPGLLAKLGGLTTLDLGGNKISDLSALAEAAELRTLNLDRNPISNFDPLHKMSKLTSLSLKGVEISYEELAALSNALPNCAIQSDTVAESAVDISVGGVTFKSDVTELDLSGLGIMDISALSSCVKLERLNLSGNEITDLYAIMNMPELKELDISYNQIRDLRPLMGLTKLSKVNAAGNLIENTVPLGAMTWLDSLNLAENPIKDFGGFKKLRGLKKLSLRNTDMTDEALEYLSDMPSLAELNIEENPRLNGEAVGKLMESLAGCTVMHSELVFSVDVGGQLVRTDTTELDLTAMGISDINNILYISQLETVRLGKNSISNLYAFQYSNSRISIKELDLSGNEIEDISALAWMQNVEVLNLSNNKIFSILPLLGLDTLKELYLSGNPLTDEQIKTLEDTLVYCKIYWN